MNESYEIEWNNLRRRSRLFWFSFFGYIPGVVIIGFPISEYFNSETPILVVAICWMVFFMTAGIYMQIFKCPRCRSNFFSRKRGVFRFYNIFSSKCLNCGLYKWRGNN
jgi:MFS-type transporter involved in bile tolerance (Atg22 family)